MTITREQVADLQPGDVVELRMESYPDVVTRGPVRVDSGGRASIGGRLLRYSNGDPGYSDCTLTVISRAPRPLYVNHPRTEPVDGDVVRDDASDEDDMCWVRLGGRWWQKDDQRASTMPARLRLLVDGETGMTVPQ